MSIDISRIKRFKNFMKFFEVSKANVDFGISTKHKVPSIDSPSDILSKTSTIMSRMLNSGRFFVSGYRNHPFLGTIQCENAVTKKRISNNIDFESESLFSTAMTYKIDSIISFDAFRNVNLVEYDKVSAVKELEVLTRDRWTNSNAVFGYSSNLILNSDDVRIFSFDHGMFQNITRKFLTFCSLTNSFRHVNATDIDQNQFANLTFNEVTHFRNGGNNDYQNLACPEDSSMHYTAIPKVAGTDYAYSASNNIITIKCKKADYERIINSDDISVHQKYDQLVDYYNSSIQRLRRYESKYIHIFNVHIKFLDGSINKSFVLTNCEHRNFILSMSFNFNFFPDTFESHERITSAILTSKRQFEFYCDRVFGPLMPAEGEAQNVE